MNMHNQQLRSLRTAIEHLNWMLEQPQYKEKEYLLRGKKEQYLKELKYMLEEE